ncbi:MAG: type II toxin-antitoxin system VapC family toxin [Nitrososphaeria archaeon]|nr:type II toxin-antitoxin system VapC family toxin [Nitrososphaeria archaeon]
MIFDTSLILKILENKEFFDKLNISEEVKITSVTAYELLRGAVYSNLVNGKNRELNIILSLVSELNVISFSLEDARIASYIWAKLKEKGIVINDADILIASTCIRNKEKLLTLDKDYEKIKSVYEKIDLEIIDKI